MHSRCFGTLKRDHYNCNNMVKEHYHDILPEREPETYRGFLVATMTTQVVAGRLSRDSQQDDMSTGLAHVTSSSMEA